MVFRPTQASYAVKAGKKKSCCELPIRKLKEMCVLSCLGCGTHVGLVLEGSGRMWKELPAKSHDDRDEITKNIYQKQVGLS